MEKFYFYVEENASASQKIKRDRYPYYTINNSDNEVTIYYKAMLHNEEGNPIEILLREGTMDDIFSILRGADMTFYTISLHSPTNEIGNILLDETRQRWTPIAYANVCIRDD